MNKTLASLALALACALTTAARPPVQDATRITERRNHPQNNTSR